MSKNVSAFLMTVFMAATATTVQAEASTLLADESTQGVSVYKCYRIQGRVSCEKIASEGPGTLPVAELEAAIDDAINSPQLGSTDSMTEVNSHGASAKCRIVGTGPNYVIIVCG